MKLAALNARIQAHPFYVTMIAFMPEGLPKRAQLVSVSIGTQSGRVRIEVREPGHLGTTVLEMTENGEPPFWVKVSDVKPALAVTATREPWYRVNDLPFEVIELAEA